MVWIWVDFMVSKTNVILQSDVISLLQLTQMPSELQQRMIRMKDQVLSPRTLSANSNRDSQQFVKLPLESRSSFYSYSSHDKAQQITDEIHCNLLSILLAFLFISIAIFTVIFGIKYIIVATATYGNPHNCLQSDISFDGWSFKLHCQQCYPNHHLDHSLHCQPI